MSRKRPRLGAEPLGLRRRRGGGPAEADPPRGAAGARVLGGGAPPGSPPRPGSARAAVAELGRLFPRGLFEDALPPIALRSQVYSLVPDRTAADRQLVRARRGPGAPPPWKAPALESTRSGERARPPQGEPTGVTFVGSGTWPRLPLRWLAASLGFSSPRSGSPVAYQC